MSLLHPRNRHQGRYDFEALYQVCPELKNYTRLNPAGRYTIDFANPIAVKLLNRALLKSQYGLAYWDIPPQYLCPPIPGRADYIHSLADLLDTDSTLQPANPHSPLLLLDIGVGANTIYPLLGHIEYGWHFVGSDIDKTALAAAQNIIERNQLTHAIELRHQSQRSHILQGLVQPSDYFVATLCNPPFFSSAAQAQQQNKRKWQNLGLKHKQRNFGGRSNELWCPGGEIAFVSGLIQESLLFKKQIRWFSTLVSRENHLPVFYKQLQQLGASPVHTLPMAQGQKKSRVLVWSYPTP